MVGQLGLGPTPTKPHCAAASPQNVAAINSAATARTIQRDQLRRSAAPGPLSCVASLQQPRTGPIPRRAGCTAARRHLVVLQGLLPIPAHGSTVAAELHTR